MMFHTWFRVAENAGLTGRNGTTCKGIKALSTCACQTRQGEVLKSNQSHYI